MNIFSITFKLKASQQKVNLHLIGAVDTAFLNHREEEAVYCMLSISMKQLSRSVVFVDSNPKHERIPVHKIRVVPITDFTD